MWQAKTKIAYDIQIKEISTNEMKVLRYILPGNKAHLHPVKALALAPIPRPTRAVANLCAALLPSSPYSYLPVYKKKTSINIPSDSN